MLACATNSFQCLVARPAIRWAADRYFPASESLLVLVDRGGAAGRRDLAGARSRESASGWASSGAFAASRAVAGVRTRLRVRDSLVCRDMLLGVRHPAPLWRAADSGRCAGADLVLHVRRALSRNVRAAAGLGRRNRDSGKAESRSDDCRSQGKASRIGSSRSGARWWRLRFFGSRSSWRGRGLPRFHGSFWDTRRREISRSRGWPHLPASTGSRLKSRS